MLGNTEKQQKLYKLQEEKEREEAEGESVGHTHTFTHTRTHSHTYSPSGDDARTPSQIQYVLRREEGNAAEQDEGRSRRGVESGTSIIKLQKQSKEGGVGPSGGKRQAGMCTWSMRRVGAGQASGGEQTKKKPKERGQCAHTVSHPKHTPATTSRAKCRRSA